jgi:copper chaperone CopZ
MEVKTVKVPNIGCNGCVNTIKNELGELAGVVKVEGQVEAKTITVQWDDPATWEKIVTVMKDIDYAPAEA